MKQSLEKNLKIFKAKVFKHIKRKNHQKFKTINDILYSWFKRCEASGIYVNGPLLEQEAINIKQFLSVRELDVFKALEDWLDKWKLSHGIKEKQISGEPLGELLKLGFSLGWSE